MSNSGKSGGGIGEARVNELIAAYLAEHGGEPGEENLSFGAGLHKLDVSKPKLWNITLTGNAQIELINAPVSIPTGVMLHITQDAVGGHTCEITLAGKEIKWSNEPIPLATAAKASTLYNLLVLNAATELIGVGSLKGEKGEKGLQGERGAEGPVGGTIEWKPLPLGEHVEAFAEEVGGEHYSTPECAITSNGLIYLTGLLKLTAPIVPGAALATLPEALHPTHRHLRYVSDGNNPAVGSKQGLLPILIHQNGVITPLEEMTAAVIPNLGDVMQIAKAH